MSVCRSGGAHTALSIPQQRQVGLHPSKRSADRRILGKSLSRQFSAKKADSQEGKRMYLSGARAQDL